MYRLFVLSALGLLGACQPEIGDSCTDGTDCSVNADRVCDVAQPSGYCSVRGCDADTCPESALCVEFRGEPARTAESWCMKRCTEDKHCRINEGYGCVQPGDPEIADSEGNSLAEILDEVVEPEEGFCVALFSEE